MKDYSEYGEKCESCKVETESRMYYRPVEAINHNIVGWSYKGWRKLCRKCWDVAEKGII